MIIFKKGFIIPLKEVRTDRSGDTRIQSQFDGCV